MQNGLRWVTEGTVLKFDIVVSVAHMVLQMDLGILKSGNHYQGNCFLYNITKCYEDRKFTVSKTIQLNNSMTLKLLRHMSNI